MRLLCTNDDGILAHGFKCLIAAAKPLGEITVVAPDREQSATSHSLTLHHPIRPIQRGDRRWQVDGTPTDCVMLAVEVLMVPASIAAFIARAAASCSRYGMTWYSQHVRSRSSMLLGAPYIAA